MLHTVLSHAPNMPAWTSLWQDTIPQHAQCSVTRVLLLRGRAVCAQMRTKRGVLIILFFWRRRQVCLFAQFSDLYSHHQPTSHSHPAARCTGFPAQRNNRKSRKVSQKSVGYIDKCITVLVSLAPVLILTEYFCILFIGYRVSKRSSRHSYLHTCICVRTYNYECIFFSAVRN